jgi:DNA-binding FadR family transcriptional regulator
VVWSPGKAAAWWSRIQSLFFQTTADLAGLAAQTSIRQLFELRKLIEVKVAGWAALRGLPEILNP